VTAAAIGAITGAVIVLGKRSLIYIPAILFRNNSSIYIKEDKKDSGTNNRVGSSFNWPCAKIWDTELKKDKFFH
jgi:hypothetical protein